MSKKTWIIAGVVVIAVAVGVNFKMKHAKQEVLLKVKKGKIIDAVYGIGTVTAKNTYALKLGVTSRIQAIHVLEGDEVKAGQPLVTLEGLTQFRAPFSGTVTSIPFKVGESVFPQTTIIAVTNLKDLYIVVSLEQLGALRVKKGQSVRVNFESLRDQNVDGVVRTIFSSDTQFIVHVDIKKLPEQVMPGMTADVAIEVQSFQDQVLVPVTAITANSIIRVRGSAREPVEIKVGAIDGEWAQVVSGDIKETDQVVVGGKK